MVSGNGSHVNLLRESAVVDHTAHGAPGLVSIHGVRYTTARETAASAVDTAFRALGRTAPECQTDRTPLIGGDIGRVADLMRTVSRERPEVPEPVITRLVRTYGTTYARLLSIAETEPHLAVPLGARCDVTSLEIVYAAREEMAVTLVDALIRRTEAGSAGHPGDDAIAQAADVLAAELNWSTDRREAEIAAVEAFYRLPS
jgi:glycerol-3-phosphate dehydrogenase